MSDGMVVTNTEPTAGALLRAAREAQGLHIAALAVSLKVPVKKLEALEAGRYEDLPDAVFARALASSVCRSLKVDATPILEKLPQTIKPRLSHPQQSINTPFRASGDGPGPGLAKQLANPLVLAVAALLVGATALLLLPDLSQSIKNSFSGGSSAATDAGMAPTPAPTPTGSVPGTADAQAVGTQVSSSVSTEAASVDSNLSVPAPTQKPSAGSTNLVISTSLGIASGTQAPAENLLVFKAVGETWVEVQDARGKVTLQRTLQAGESVGTDGAPPLRVTVGRADQTQIILRGQAYVPSAKVRDNVVKFEVK